MLVVTEAVPEYMRLLQNQSTCSIVKKGGCLLALLQIAPMRERLQSIKQYLTKPSGFI
jgi:hypothetical protein